MSGRLLAHLIPLNSPAKPSSPSATMRKAGEDVGGWEELVLARTSELRSLEAGRALLAAHLEMKVRNWETTFDFSRLSKFVLPPLTPPRTALEQRRHLLVLSNTSTRQLIHLQALRVFLLDSPRPHLEATLLSVAIVGERYKVRQSSLRLVIYLF